jgi:16S rRNA (guanine527-N7)-methyltransferase
MCAVGGRRPVPEPLDAAGFARIADVSRETRDRLTRYASLLEKWSGRINLVGRATLPDLWRRHMLDSAQLYPLIPESARNLVDLGSGAGFPGLVLAIMGVPDVHLIESNARKCAFLREVARATGTKVSIHNVRIEVGIGIKADVVTARALAPLPLLLDYAKPYLTQTSVCLFLKGSGVDEELTKIRDVWNIRERIYPSITDPEGVVLCVEALSHDPAR